MDIRKKRTLIIIGIFIVVLSLVEFSYALWKLTWSQKDENIVNLDCFKISFTETPDSGVHLQKAFPLTDEEGKKLTPYHFTITNECESSASYTIQLESKDTSTLDEDYLKTMLNENEPKLTSELDEGELTKNLGTDKAYVLETGTLNAKDTKEYDFRVWLDESVTTETEGIQNKNWSGIITLNTTYKPPISNKGVLRKINVDVSQEYGYIDTEGMWGYKDQITKVVFENKLEPHEEIEGILSFDESVDHDGSVMSYLVPNEDNPEKYTAYLQGNGGVKGNIDSSGLFWGFGHVQSIDNLEYFDTSQVENMEYMFSAQIYEVYIADSDLTNLDLSTLDTSSATNMSHMFYNLNELTSLKFSKSFDTSNVTDMNYMFYNLTAITSLELEQANFNAGNVITADYIFSYMENLTDLYLGSNFNAKNMMNVIDLFVGLSSLKTLNLGENFNASSATNMQNMFSHLTNLISLDLGDNFNASSATDMSYMFQEMRNLETLDLGDNFNSINVVNMGYMFYELPKLTTLNLGNHFYTNNVTNMNSMFRNISQLTFLDLETNFDTRNVTDMYGMFFDMISLTTLDLGEHFDTSNVTDMSHMFYNDSSLVSIEYGPLFVHKDGAEIDYMFGNCPDTLNKPDHESWQGVTWD